MVIQLPNINQKSRCCLATWFPCLEMPHVLSHFFICDNFDNFSAFKRGNKSKKNISTAF